MHLTGFHLALFSLTVSGFQGSARLRFIRSARMYITLALLRCQYLFSKFLKALAHPTLCFQHSSWVRFRLDSPDLKAARLSQLLHSTTTSPVWVGNFIKSRHLFAFRPAFIYKPGRLSSEPPSPRRNSLHISTTYQPRSDLRTSLLNCRNACQGPS